MTTMIELRGVAKTFVMHLRGGIELPVIRDASFDVAAGECVVLGGPSGAGKSSILKMIYGNYRIDAGSICVAGPNTRTNIAVASPREILMLRRSTIGYVSQFLRAIPRVSTKDIVAAAARECGEETDRAGRLAGELLERLNIPSRLWALPPATFSGGEQQRVNIARGFAAHRPILLLDEPTASLDEKNRAVVVELIEQRKRSGAAVLGIFHDVDVRDRVADRVVDVSSFSTRGTAQ
jgi:alpha-D-ribose 1-methylphosphonate 5-triphosphate synthase subunit PhnL